MRRVVGVSFTSVCRQAYRGHSDCHSGTYTILRQPDSFVGAAVPVKAWVNGVDVDATASTQILKLAQLPILKHPIAVMPDVHGGVGATVGTVVPTYRAIIPAAVGVDIGCGMIALKTTLVAEDLPGNLAHLRLAIELAVPHGRTHNGNASEDAGGWRNNIPVDIASVWKEHLQSRFTAICAKQPAVERSNHIGHLGTLGTGNHFIELCLEDQQAAGQQADVHKYEVSDTRRFSASPVWLMIHSGSRGVGGKIGSTYIELAKKDMGALVSNLPDKDMAYFNEGAAHFDEYVEAVHWAQDYAKWNREIMMRRVLEAMRTCKLIKKPFAAAEIAVNCHHNYVEKYDVGAGGNDFVWLTRKGATSARKGELAVIPGSMGARSYIVRGKGNHESYNSCSHGAGRRFSRGEATRRFTLDDHEQATAGVECRKDAGVLDETPAAYKPIEAVMKAQDDLVDVVCVLKQVLCVKG